MSNVQKNKKQAIVNPIRVVPPRNSTPLPADHITDNGIDYRIVEDTTVLFYLSAVRQLRICLRSWYLLFVGKNVDTGVTDGNCYSELLRLVNGIHNNCVYEGNTREGLRKVINDFYVENTGGDFAKNSDAVRMRHALTEWFICTMDDFDSRDDEMESFNHTEAFHALDSILNLVISCHEDGIVLYGSADDSVS